MEKKKASTKTSSKKIEKKKTISKKSNKKVEKKKLINKKAIKEETKRVLHQKIDVKHLIKVYTFPCMIFSLLLTLFNFIFIVLSFYAGCMDGFFFLIFDNVVVNVLVNTIFDIIFFYAVLMIYTISIIEGIFKNK